MKHLKIETVVMAGALHSEEEKENFIKMNNKQVIAILEYQGDFSPMAWLLVGSDIHIYIGNITESAETKAAFNEYIRKEANKLDAFGYAFATEMYMLELKTTKDATKEESIKAAKEQYGKGGLANRADSIECLMVNYEINDRAITYFYSQNRDSEGVPHCKLRKTSDTDKGETMEGLFQNVIKK